MSVIRSRENKRVKSWIRLAQAPRERRQRGLALIEGFHLVETFLRGDRVPTGLIVSESALDRTEIAQLMERSGIAPVVLSDTLFNQICDAGMQVGIAAEIQIPHQEIDPAGSTGCLFLEGIQDAGNVGTILRTATAFGVRDVLLGSGCADPWSPKALRAGMGGHFYLRIAASADLCQDVIRFGVRSICTAPRGGEPLGSIDLTGRIGWIFGNEGAGVSAAVAGHATHIATIATPGNAESLNVAASVAICLYEQERQLSKRDA